MPKTKTISPYIVTIIILFTIGIISIIPLENLFLKFSISSFHAEYLNLFLKMSILIIIGYATIRKFNLKNIAGLSTNYSWKFKYLNAIPIYLLLLGLASVLSADLTKIELPNMMLLLLSYFAVGFAEEFLFRGVLQSFFLKKYLLQKSGIFLGTFIPALTFGLFHLVNIFKNGEVIPVLIQVVFATFIGFFFGVILIKTNKLIPIAITHALINFSFSLQYLPNFKSEVVEESSNVSFTPIIICLPLLIIALFLIRKINKAEVHKKINESF